MEKEISYKFSEYDRDVNKKIQKILNNMVRLSIKINLSIMGMVLSLLLSYVHEDSFLRMIFHGFLGWFYVIYCFFTNNLF